MSANVRCVGGGQVARDPAPFGLGPTHYERATHGQPCGWKGERFPKVGDYPWDRWFTKAVQQQYYAKQTERILAKPCPRCGGRVELIPPNS